MAGFILCLLSLSPALFSQDIPPTGLAVGQEAPLFNAVDYLGNEVDLAKKLNEGPVVLMFYRGVWCPHCNRQLKAMEDSLSFIAQKGGTVIAVTPERVELVEKTARKTKASFHIIHDQNLQIMNDYQVSFQVKQATLERYLQNGIDLQANNGENGAYLPVPATYIIGQDRKIVFAFFDPDYRKRATISSILKYL